MKLSQMKEIAARRTQGEAYIGHVSESFEQADIGIDGVAVATAYSIEDQNFYCMAANNIDALIRVAECAKRYVEHGRVDCFKLWCDDERECSCNKCQLDQALAELEK